MAQSQFNLPPDNKWYLIAEMSGRHGSFEYVYSHTMPNNPSFVKGAIRFINARNITMQTHQSMGYYTWNQPQFALLNLGNVSQMWVKASTTAETGAFIIRNADYVTVRNGTVSDVNLGDNGGTVTYYEKIVDDANILVGNVLVEKGNVGIGTTNPKAKLAVEGNILATEIKVKTDISVPDYVFEPDYKMLSLTEIENYVKEHKHLPEIPSANMIRQNGLDLAEMNLSLLKKVEELTLHLIEKDKLLTDVVKRLERLEKK
jgi:hypothetical protein